MSIFIIDGECREILIGQLIMCVSACLGPPWLGERGWIIYISIDLPRGSRDGVFRFGLGACAYHGLEFRCLGSSNSKSDR